MKYEFSIMGIVNKSIKLLPLRREGRLIFFIDKKSFMNLQNLFRTQKMFVQRFY